MEVLRILTRMTAGDHHNVLDLLKQDHAAVAETGGQDRTRRSRRADAEDS